MRMYETLENEYGIDVNIIYFSRIKKAKLIFLVNFLQNINDLENPESLNWR